jgi:transposase-like protein
MKKSDVICPHCGAGFRRIELSSEPGFEQQYRCPACDTVLEAFDGRNLVAYRLTVQPSVKTLNG